MEVSIGHSQVDLHQVDAALTAFRTALAVGEALVSKDPTNIERQLFLVDCHEGMGEGLRAAHDVPAALTEYRQAAALAKHVSQLDPKNEYARIVAARVAKAMATLPQ
jgi:hypothetical protein